MSHPLFGAGEEHPIVTWQRLGVCPWRTDS